MESKIDAAALAALPSSGAIVHGSGKHRVTVFSDMRCGYCRQLYDTLSGMDVKVVERPISVLGTRPLSKKVICSSDPRRALKQAYAGDDLAGPGAKDCDTSGLDANEAFARQNGFTGSPVIVREDGEFLAGFRPKDVLDQWLNEGEVQ